MSTTALDHGVATTGAPSSRRATAALFVVGGLLMAAGGQLHPVGSGETVDAHLLSMFGDARWDAAHVLLLVGAVVDVLAFVSAWRTRALGSRATRLLPVAVLGWAFGALELVPHLLAASEAGALAHHEATPLIDLHVVLQVIASPAVGLTGAGVAVAVARGAATWPARLLAVVGVLGGVVSALAAPLVVLSGDPRFAALFPFQAGLAVWLVGTGIRLLRPARTGVAR